MVSLLGKAHMNYPLFSLATITVHKSGFLGVFCLTESFVNNFLVLREGRNI